MTTELKTLRTHESANEAPAVKNVADDVLENVNLEAENEPKRSRIQIIALLIALNVGRSILNQDCERSADAAIVGTIYRRCGSDNSSDSDTDYQCRITFCWWLHMDRYVYPSLIRYHPPILSLDDIKI
jgi:hypothetical protein